MCRRKVLAIVLLSAAFLSAHQAGAAILFTTGAMTEIFSPVSLLEGDTESSTVISILDEGLTTLPIEIFVNKVGDGLHSGPSGTPIPIAAGTLVNTYIVHLDSPGGVVSLTGGVFFDLGETILGIQTHTPWLDGSDAAVGDAMVTYPTGLLTFRAFETLPLDTLTITPLLESVSFSLIVELEIDQARIVTLPVPEPSAFVLLLLGAAAFYGARRRLRLSA